MADKLLAEWFWIDRYDGSSAALLNMECQGVYRLMLSQAWRRGARLPNDHEAIRRAIRCTPKEWARAWPKLERFWRADGENGEFLVNDTQLEVYAEAKAAAERAGGRARKAAEARWSKEAGARAQGYAQAHPRAQREECPPSPSPDKQKPPFPPAPAGGRPRGEVDADVRALVAYWRLLGQSDPRVPGGQARSPATIPTDQNVRTWRRDLRDGTRSVEEIKAGIAHAVHQELTRLGIPVWDVEPWPPAEAEEARAS